MAVLDNKAIRGNLSAVFAYTNNLDKNLSNVATYIRGEHSIERLYSRGHNGCSSNPELAIQQFKACESLYRQKKGGARESGMTEGKQPVIAEHFFLSFANGEIVPYQTQCEIADKICSSSVLKDFYAVSNSHWNTDNDHMHILVCNTSKDGTHKLSMNNAKRNELRKELDRICVEHGLSIIDDPALRWKDPEREQFIKRVVKTTDITVYAPEDYRKQLNMKYDFDRWMLDRIIDGRVTVAESRSKNYKCTQSEAYKRWIASQEVFIRERDKQSAKEKKAVLLHQSELRRRSNVYFYDHEYRCSRNGEYYYAVRRYDDYGHHKPMLLLLIELIYLVATQEELFFDEKYPRKLDKNGNEILNISTDRRLQNAYDAFRYQREQGVRTPAELTGRIEVVGTDLAEARKGLAYYQRTIEKGNDLNEAINVFHALEKRDRTEEEELAFKEAYRIMAVHKCTERIDIGDFWRRRDYATKKVEELEKKVEQLKKDFHDLKHIERHTTENLEAVEYFVHQNKDSHSIDDLVNRATRIAENPAATEKEKISEKN